MVILSNTSIHTENLNYGRGLRSGKIDALKDRLDSLNRNRGINKLVSSILSECKGRSIAGYTNSPLNHRFFSDIKEMCNLTSFQRLMPLEKSAISSLERIDSRGIPICYRELIEEFLDRNLLGKNTRSKFGKLRNITGNNDINRSINGIIEKVKTDHIHFDTFDSKFLEEMIILAKYSGLYAYLPGEFEVFWDEIMTSLGRTLSFTIEDESFSIGYVPRDMHYFFLGNSYGDCTSFNKDNQIDDVKNIFWTNGSWILNPFYQILEIKHNGHHLIKAHLVLMSFRGALILCLDAIETVPSMREFIGNRGTSGTINPTQSSIFHLRHQLLHKLLEYVKEIGEHIGVQTILVEEYSNTTWVRSDLQYYEQVFFKIDELHEVFDGEIIDTLYQDRTGQVLTDKGSEIQLLNINLQDKGLKIGVNSARLIKGNIGSVEKPIRGI